MLKQFDLPQHYISIGARVTYTSRAHLHIPRAIISTFLRGYFFILHTRFYYNPNCAFTTSAARYFYTSSKAFFTPTSYALHYHTTKPYLYSSRASVHLRYYEETYSSSTRVLRLLAFFSTFAFGIFFYARTYQYSPPITRAISTLLRARAFSYTRRRIFSYTRTSSIIIFIHQSHALFLHLFARAIFLRQSHALILRSSSRD